MGTPGCPYLRGVYIFMTPGSRSGQGVKGCFGVGQAANLVTAVNVLRVRIEHSVVKCVRSNGQGPICGAVERSSNKNDGQHFLTPVAAVTSAPIG